MKTLALAIFAVFVLLATFAADTDAFRSVLPPIGKRELVEKLRQQ